MLKKSDLLTKQLSSYPVKVLLNESFFNNIRFHSLIDVLDKFPTEMIYALSSIHFSIFISYVKKEQSNIKAIK